MPFFRRNCRVWRDNSNKSKIPWRNSTKRASRRVKPKERKVTAWAKRNKFRISKMKFRRSISLAQQEFDVLLPKSKYPLKTTKKLRGKFLVLSNQLQYLQLLRHHTITEGFRLLLNQANPVIFSSILSKPWLLRHTWKISTHPTITSFRKYKLILPITSTIRAAKLW